MPEGDTVWLVANRLDESLRDQVITKSDFRVPTLATASVVGDRVQEVVPRGKHILMRFGSGQTLHSHLRMDGMWHLFNPSSRWTGGPTHQIRVILAVERVTAVGYHLHDLALVPTSEEVTLVGHLGPDLLDPDFDISEAMLRLTAQPEREIGQALLDQRNVAGIGNIYKAETLFMQGINPWTPVGDLEPDRVEAVLTLAQRLLNRNKGHFSQATTGDPRRGFEHWVTARTGKPCRKCGTRIRKAEQGQPPRQRVTYWCPTCQPAQDPV